MKTIKTLSLTLAIVALAATGAMAGMLEVGTAAPDFTLTDHMGKTHKLSDYQGKVVVLEWVNPDCPFVVRHYNADTMTNLAKKLGDDVVWMAVNTTKYFDQEANAKFAKAEGVTYPILDDHTGEVGRMYHAKTTPHMFVIDAKGMIAYNGAIDDDPRGKNEEITNYVAAAVKNLMAGEKVSTASTKPYGCSVKYADKPKATS